MFSVGQEVECINDDWNCKFDGLKLPVVGDKVTIIEIAQPYAPRYKSDYLFLAECEPRIGFLATHFRAIQKKKTDISVFTAMLDKVPEDA